VPTTGAVPMLAERVLVYGVTGSGKSEAARRIGAAVGLPVHLVDELTWEPEWVEVPREEQQRRIGAVCDGPSWVLDGAYSFWLDLPLSRADLIVALDYPRLVSLGRLVRRTIRRLVTRETMCNGNVETLRRAFSRHSIVAWHFRSFARKRRRIRSWAAAVDGPPVLHLRRPVDMEAWLDTLA
jgi:adenylate kinase family enzyme